MNELDQARRPRLDDWWWRRSIRGKLNVLLGLVAALAVLVPALLGILLRLQEVHELALEETLRVARNAAEQVSNQQLQLEQELLLLALDPALVEDAATGNAARLTTRLEAVGQADPDLTGLVVVDTSGTVRAVSFPDKSAIGVDISPQVQIAAALQRGQPGVGAARIQLVTGKPIVPFAVPIRDGSGRVIAALQGTLSLARLSDQLARYRVGRTGYVSLIDHDCLVLATPDDRRILTPADPRNAVLIEAVAGQTTAAETVGDAGEEVFAAAVPIEPSGWIVVAQVAREERFTPLWGSLVNSALVALLALLLAIAVGTLVARRFTAPILALRAATHRFAQGDYSAVPDIDRGDELRYLAADFSVMAGRLQEAMAGMEARAAELARLYTEAERQRALATATLDASDEAIIFVEADGRIELTNRRVERLLGVPPERLRGWRFDGQSPALPRIFADADRFVELVRDTANDPERVLAEIVATIWPEQRELALYSAPVSDEEGRFLGRLFVFRDITHEREIDRMKSEFISLVSHELRTPLTSIKGYVDLMRDGAVGDLNGEQAEFLQIVSANSDRLIALINDLLDISRIESGRVELQWAPVDLADLLRQLATSLRPQFEGKQHRFTLDTTAVEAPIWGDHRRIEQIVTNLLSNAYKYTPVGGSITVTAAARADDGLATVEVSDTGVGLTEAEQAQLFQKFYRADNRATREVSGTGLGLSISRSLAEMHGGTITVRSRPGAGATFRVTLPIYREAAVPPPTPDSAQPAGPARTGSRILVIEDDADIARLIRRYLERAGYRVRVAPTAAEAVAAIAAARPDLITLDIILPDLDGLVLLDRLKRDPATAAIPILLLSILPDTGGGRRLGAVDHLSKPVHEGLLLDRVGLILANDHSRTRRRVVLVADDEADVRRLIAGLLDHAGYEAITATDGTEALAQARREHPDLILLDARMPGLGGIATLQALRVDADTAAIPVVMMTASSDALDSAHSAVEALGASILTKPHSAEELATLIAHGLGNPTPQPPLPLGEGGGEG